MCGQRLHESLESSVVVMVRQQRAAPVGFQQQGGKAVAIHLVQQATAGLHVLEHGVAVGAGPGQCEACAVQSFWMKDTPLPLSIAFLDDDGTILKIADLEPHDLRGESSEHAVRFVLEVNQGWFSERGIAPGARLAGPVFPA